MASRKSGTTTSAPRAALYTRCSTDKQDTGLQIEECRAVAEQRGWEVVGVYDDPAVSGTRVSRPALDRLVADAKVGKIDVVVVLKLP
jgi:DNA invertase Pin-like site-specific DNA recombinase